MRRPTFPLRAAGVLLLLLPLSATCQFESLVKHVSQPNYTHYLDELLFTRTGDNRGPSSLQHDVARNSIRDTFASFGMKVTLEPFEYQGSTFYNVSAVLPGILRPDEYHVIGAHYDSVSNPGADDNASGVAALLEAARVASAHDFEASLVFVAFDREEAGLIGSKAWVAAHSADRVLSMLELDMIAFNPPGRTYNLVALCVPNTAPNSTLAVIRAAVAHYSGSVTPVDCGVSTGSDHYAFAALAPAVQMVEAGFSQNTNYHHSSDSVDTPDYIDYGFASAITRSVVGYLAKQASLLPADSFTARLSPGAVFNSASFIAGAVAPAELVTLIGSGFGDKPSVVIRDRLGNEKPAPLVYASPSQINLLVPESLAPGAATIHLQRDDGSVAAVAVQVQPIAPGIFTAESNGLNGPAAQAIRISPGGEQAVQNLFDCTAGAAACVITPVDFGGEADRVILILYGTGIRGRSDAAAVTLAVGGQLLPVQYAGAQPTYPGLDQVNVELPRSLRGKRRLPATLRVDGKAANPVTIDLGTK